MSMDQACQVSRLIIYQVEILNARAPFDTGDIS